MGVNAISKELDLVPSTCLHILRVLVAEGLVAPETRGKRYTLDVGILSLARSLIRSDEMIRFTQPELDRISRRYNVSMIAEKTIDIEHSPVVVAVSHSSSAMRLNVEVGSRFPTLVSATGRCYAAFGNVSDDELAEHFPKLRWSIAPSKRDWKSQVRGEEEGLRRRCRKLHFWSYGGLGTHYRARGHDLWFCCGRGHNSR